MATYDAETLLAKWKTEELMLEMAIGHLIQRLLEHEEQLRVLERAAAQTDEER